MGYLLCMTDNRNIAEYISNVIGATQECNGYFNGNGYRVTWLIGHMVTLAEFINETGNKVNVFDDFSFFPNDFSLIVLPEAKQQFDVIRNLINNNECDEIIDCGELTENKYLHHCFILEKMGCIKPVKKLDTTILTEQAIIKSMNKLQCLEGYKSIISAEYCKAKADWIVETIISRCASIICNDKIEVGRIELPTLFFVVQRYLEIQSCKSKSNFEIVIDFIEGLSITCKSSTKKSETYNLFDNIKKSRKGKVIGLEKKIKAINRPQLYNLADLERDGNEIYGYTTEQVLEAAHRLYEVHKVISDPRTDSRYITKDLEECLRQSIYDISLIDMYKDSCLKILKEGLNIDQRVLNEFGTEGHHAIICTEYITNYNDLVLDQIETHVLHLIITRIITALSNIYIYEDMNIDVELETGIKLSSNKKITLSNGWKEHNEKLLKKKNQPNNIKQLVEKVRLGENIDISNIEVTETTECNLHTEATLITAMEQAGTRIDNGNTTTKRTGIGTPESRARIIKQLITKGFIISKEDKEKKIEYLVPTKKGIEVIKALPKELYSPKITSDWENLINMVANGTFTEKIFIEKFEIFIKEEIEKIKENLVEKNILKKLGTCPWCQEDLYQDEKRIEKVYCRNKQCKFSIRTDDLVFKLRTNKNMTLIQIKEIIDNGEIETECISKSGVTYKGIFRLIKSNTGYPNLIFEMPKKKNKKVK